MPSRAEGGEQEGLRLVRSAKKKDVAEHLAVFDHVGLLADEPPVTAGLPFI
jgi:hypothetical protein